MSRHNPILDQPVKLEDLFTGLTRTAHTGDRHKPELRDHYFVTVSRRTEPLQIEGVEIGAKFENGEFMCTYGMPSAELEAAVLPYMSEGEIGSFELIRWPDGVLNLFVRSRNHISSYRAAIVSEEK